MIDAQRIYLTRRDHTRLLSELVALRSRRSIEVPDDFMDYHAMSVDRYSARKARIREIEDLLAGAIVSDDTAEHTAGPGMVVTIRYDDTGETDTFLLGRYGAEDAGIKAYSTLSPLGRAIAGARPGERRICSVPDGANLAVTLISAVPRGSRAIA